MDVLRYLQEEHRLLSDSIVDKYRVFSSIVLHTLRTTQERDLLRQGCHTHLNNMVILAADCSIALNLALGGTHHEPRPRPTRHNDMIVVEKESS